MNKKTLLFWIFEIPILYILLRIYAYFVSPLVSGLFGTTAFDIIIVLIVIVPLSLILSKLTSDFFFLNESRLLINNKHKITVSKR